MTTYQERIEAARKVIIFAYEHAEAIRRELGIAALDQNAAAVRDVDGWMQRLTAVMPFRGDWCGFDRIEGATFSPQVVEAMARAVASSMGLTRCCHIRANPNQPTIAQLPLYRLDCRRCARTKRNPSARDADRCDWCGARGAEIFTPVALQVGPLVAMGDACDDCATALGADKGRRG